MSYLVEIANELYTNLVNYYYEHKKEFFTMSNTRYVDHFVHDSVYRIMNDKDSNFVNIAYPELSKGLFDVDFVGDCLEKTAHIGIKCNDQDFEKSKLLRRHFENEDMQILKEFKKFAYTLYVMNNFIKKVRLYYLEDFMYDSSLARELLAFKAEISLVYPKNSRDLEIDKFESIEEFVKTVEETKMSLLDRISDVVDSDSFKKLVLKQQEFYVNELTRLQEVIEKEGNKFRCSDEVFLIYCEFIEQFKQKALGKITTLNEEPKQLKKSI